MEVVARNMTGVKEFILLGFHLPPLTANFVFCIILLCYIITMTGNFLILALVSCNINLQKPMYLFLCNLAIIDICFTNVTIPNMLHGLIWGKTSISLDCCFFQSSIFFLSGTAECILIALMSVDRYLAICKPLHYGAIMHRRMCIRLIIWVWLGSLFYLIGPTALIMRLTFCFHNINHFFCDVGPLLRNSCTDTTFIRKVLFTSSFILIYSFLVSLVSYMKIVHTIVQIKSVEGRGRAFSTCSSHALVVTLAYGSCIFIYSKPIENQGFDYDKKVSVLNTIVVPLINPFIYTLRNKNFKESLKKSVYASICSF